MSDDIIRRSLGMDLSEVVEQNAMVPYEPPVEQPRLEEDFDYVVDNLKDLIAKGQEAIDELILIAKQSQHPRAFEVIATLLKATADMNNDVLAAHKRKHDIRPAEGAPHSKGVANVTNNLFVGSTADLQNFLEQKKKNEQQ